MSSSSDPISTRPLSTPKAVPRSPAWRATRPSGVRAPIAAVYSCCEASTTVTIRGNVTSGSIRSIVCSSSVRPPRSAQNCLGTPPVTAASRRPLPAARTTDQSWPAMASLLHHLNIDRARLRRRTFFLLLPLALDRQDAVVDAHLHVVFAQGEVGFDEVLLLGLLHIEGRRPPSEPLGLVHRLQRPSEEPAEARGHLLELTKRIESSQLHVQPPCFRSPSRLGCSHLSDEIRKWR